MGEKDQIMWYKTTVFYGRSPEMPPTQDWEAMFDRIVELPAVIGMDRHDQHALIQRLRGQSVTELDRTYAELTTEE